MKEALDHLEKIKTGAVADAVHFPGAGKYDLPYGHSGDGRSSGLGWAKIKYKHPEITPDVLEAMSSHMKVKGRPKHPEKTKELILKGKGYTAGVKHHFEEEPYRWLKTFFKDVTPNVSKKGRKR